MRRKSVFSILMLMSFLGFLSGAVAGTCDTEEDPSLVGVIQGVETTGIGLSLRRGGWICGHVCGADGITPIEHANVQVFDVRWWNAPWESTDEQGYYRVGGLAAGQYYVVAGEWSQLYEARYYDDSETQEGATPVNVVEGRGTTGIDFSLPGVLPGPTGSICGHVHEVDGLRPVECVFVEAQSLDGSYRGRDWTDSDGHYQIQHLPPGQYYVQAAEFSSEYFLQYYDRADIQEEASSVEVLAGADTRGIDFYLRQPAPTERGSISGQVCEIDTATPVEGVGVWAYSLEGFPYYPAEGTTRSGGHYQICGLVPGQYYVRAGDYSDYLPRWYGAGPTDDGAVAVTVAAGVDTPWIDFLLPLGGSISGHIYEADGHTRVAGLVCVEAYDMGWNYVTGASTDDDGYYKIGGLEAGQYYIGAGEWSEHYIMRWPETAQGYDMIECGQRSEYVPAYYAPPPPTIESLRASPEGLVLRWTSEEGRSYKVLTSTDLSSWAELPTEIPAAPGQSFTEWPDSNAFTFPRRFYKVKQLER